MQSKRVRKLRTLARGVGLNEREAQQLSDLRIRKLKGLAFALRDFQGGSVLPDLRDGVAHVVPYALASGTTATQQLDPIPEEHVLSNTLLPLLGGCSDEAGSDVFGEECFVHLPIQNYTSPVTDDEIMAGWTFESGQGAGCLDRLGKRLCETLAALDQGTVKIK